VAEQDTVIIDATNEAYVIASAIADVQTRRALVHKLSADEFLVSRHAPIWRALKTIADRGLDYSPEVADRLLKDEGADDATVTYLRGLEGEAKLVDNLDWHVATMQWDATRARTLKGPLPELLKQLRDPRAAQADVGASARAVARALESGGRRYMKRGDELHRSYRADIAARRATVDQVRGIGNPVFDAKLSEGYIPGRTHLIVGLSGCGKSTVEMALAILLAKQRRRVLIGAWEMNAKSLVDVGVCHMTGIELKRLVQGRIDDEEEDRADKAARWITSRIRFMENPFFDPSQRGKKPSNERNLDILEGYVAESGCEIAFYDLWERMLAVRDPDSVSSGLFRMQGIHEEYGITGVILHHLNGKDVEQRADRRPTRGSIRGVNTFVEVPDLILGVHRDAQFKAVEDNAVETICLKQRKGEANWAMRWAWNGATCAVRDPEEVNFDPGLEASMGDAGDVGVKDTNQIKSKPGGRRRRE
jgi:replicative DNA helicase